MDVQRRDFLLTGTMLAAAAAAAVVIIKKIHFPFSQFGDGDNSSRHANCAQLTFALILRFS